MAEFFRINDPNEDKVVSKEQRIYIDALKTASGQTQIVTTTSKAPKQRIKFFLDVIRLELIAEGTTHYVKVGKYYELEHREVGRAITSKGIIDFYFTCSDGVDAGLVITSNRYSWELTAVPPTNIRNIQFFVSEVLFEDSYYNPLRGWLNPENPDNIIDDIDDDDDTLPCDCEGGDGKVVISNTLNGGVAFMHHWGFINHHFIVEDNPDNKLVLVYSIPDEKNGTLWCIFADYTYNSGQDLGNVTYLVTCMANGADPRQEFYNIAGFSCNLGSNAITYNKPDIYENYGGFGVPMATLPIAQTTDTVSRYIDYTFGVAKYVNNDYVDDNTQPEYLTSSVNIKGTIVSMTGNDGTRAVRLLGCKLVLIHNGANSDKFATKSGSWPDWAEGRTPQQPQNEYWLTPGYDALQRVYWGGPYVSTFDGENYFWTPDAPAWLSQFPVSAKYVPVTNGEPGLLYRCIGPDTTPAPSYTLYADQNRILVSW